jgi:hypothetical protein
MESRRFRMDRLGGLVAVGPERSGVPFWVWCWNGGVSEEADPLTLVARGPSLHEDPVARVSVWPTAGTVLDGPLLEADIGFGRLVAWLEANRPVICGYWYQVGPVRADELLTRLRPAPGPIS